MNPLTLTPHVHQANPQVFQFKHTIPAYPRDYSDWHHGRTTYAVWTIDVDTPHIVKRFYKAQAHLSAYLMKPYRRQPHITAFVCGFLTEKQTFDDDYTHHKRTRHIQAIRNARIAPFELAIGGIDSFATAPYLKVLDPEGGLKRIRNLLSNIHSEIRVSPYIPHVTLGLYAGSFENGLLADKTASFQDTLLIRQQVKEIRLTTYSAQEMAGPLAVHDTVTLDPPRNRGCYP